MSLSELLLVDGYNVIHASDRYLELVDESKDDAPAFDSFVRARERLIGDVAGYACGHFDAAIVFDGAGNVNPERPLLMRTGVRLIFSSPGQTADTVIEMLAVKAREDGKNVTIITSDRLVQETVRGRGITCLSSALFVDEVCAAETETTQELSRKTHAKFTIETLIDADTRIKIDALLGIKRPKHGGSQ